MTFMHLSLFSVPSGGRILINSLICVSHLELLSKVGFAPTDWLPENRFLANGRSGSVKLG